MSCFKATLIEQGDNNLIILDQANLGVYKIKDM